MALTDSQKLRQLLGETVAAGQSAEETLFSEEEIEGFLETTPGNLDRAALQGWRVKAAKLSNLVDTTEGNSQKKFGQLLDNALDMQKLYLRSSEGPTEGRTRVGRIRREPVPWE